MSHHPNQARRGFTLVELLVVIGIIALLISILLPTLSSARKSAKAIKCASNQRSIAQGMITYAGEHSGQLMPGFYKYVRDNGAADNSANGSPVEAYQEWTHAVSGILNTGRRNGYLLPWTVAAVIDTDADDNYSPALYCPEVASDFNGATSHYLSNSTIMPHMQWNRSTQGISNSSMQPFKLSQAAAGNFLTVDGTQLQFAGSPTRENGISIWPGAAFNGIDLANQLYYFNMDATPSDAWSKFQSKTGEPASVSLDPSVGVTFPVAVPGIAAPLGSDVFQPNADLVIGGGSLYPDFAGPRFRHGSEDTANMSFIDGSVRNEKWQPRQEHDAGPDYVNTTITRQQVRPNWPNRLYQPDSAN